MATEVLEHATEERLTRQRATAEEFWSLPESVLPVEYINGEIVMSPTPTVLHQTILANIFVALHAFVKARSLGVVFPAPLDVVLPTGDIVQPDIFFLTTKQAERVSSAKRVEEVPPFLVEVISPGSLTHDMIRKRALYEKSGVREYWIVNPTARSIAQLVLKKKHYTLTEVGESDVIKSAVLTGFDANVGELLGS